MHPYREPVVSDLTKDLECPECFGELELEVPFELGPIEGFLTVWCPVCQPGFWKRLWHCLRAWRLGDNP